jgi:hypothetical protein
MSKKKNPQNSKQQQADAHGSHKQKQYFILGKKVPGTVHVEWSGDHSDPPQFNLTFIDDSLAPSEINHRVLGYHVGHDHGYGLRHRHYYAATNTLDDSYVWVKCAAHFVQECNHELTAKSRTPPAHLTVATLAEVMS